AAGQRHGKPHSSARKPARWRMPQLVAQPRRLSPARRCRLMHHSRVRTGDARDRTRVASLDGLRGLALVAVLAYHVAPGVFPAGFLGVDIFYVLAGFLLTTVLLGEHELSGAIDRMAYAIRRVRRIAPALLVL